MCLPTGGSSVILWIGPFHMVVSAFGQSGEVNGNFKVEMR